MTERMAVTLGRCLLGLYFLAPGLSKISSYQAMLDYMALHNIPMPELLLPITTALQVGGGLCLIAGYRIQLMALMFAGMTLLINLGMHDFWNSYPETDRGHELQNFIKNLGIFAGLLVLSAGHQLQQWRLIKA
ncbi:MAG: DoxX family protein [Luminiphilus sp.]|nr:DoxX family protein [Luminiphilus sp.]